MPIALRILVAVVGGYLLVSSAIVFCVPLLPMPPERAVLAVSQPGYAVYAVFILWMFATSNPWRASACCIILTALMAAAALLLRGAAS